MGRFHEASLNFKRAYVTLQNFTPDLQKLYTDTPAMSVTFCNSGLTSYLHHSPLHSNLGQIYFAIWDQIILVRLNVQNTEEHIFRPCVYIYNRSFECVEMAVNVLRSSLQNVTVVGLLAVRRQLNRWPCHWLTDSLTDHSLITHWSHTFWFRH